MKIVLETPHHEKDTKLDDFSLEKDFPHIMKNLILHWNSKSFDEYLDSIFFTDRQGRRGFPYQVIDELLFLKSIHRELHPIKINVWSFR